MADADDIHALFVRALARYAPLDAVDEAAARAVPLIAREIAASTYLVREGQRPARCALVLDGYVYRQKLTAEGQRAITGLLVPGDFIDVQNLFLAESDHDVLALTRAVIADIAAEDLRRLAAERPAINRALWTGGLIEGSMSREWLLNIGRRGARQRVAHLICEFATRLQAAGRARAESYELPMTQEQLGDALGLTAVHINRVLKGLEADGLIRRRKREVAASDWPALRRIADFNERYLHARDQQG